MKSAILRAFTLSCLFSFGVSSNMNAQKISLKEKNIQLKHVFQRIESASKYKIAYNNTKLNVNKEVSLQSENKDVLEILSLALKGTGFSYRVNGNYIAIVKEGTQQAENKHLVKGVVKDSEGNPVVGASVKIVGASLGTITDMDGRFSIKASASDRLVISYIGFKTQEVQVVPNKELNVRMKEDALGLNEVVVTALGIKRNEKAVGYSTQRVMGDVLEIVKGAELGSALNGKIAGLNVYNGTEFAETPKLYLRGSEPLIVLDGVPYRGLSLKDISPDDVESMDVLKGATASALYGNRGAIGCIMITTKKAKKEGLEVNINSGTMFQGGYLKFPETQSRYSAGVGGKYAVDQYVWGDIMDAGRIYPQYNPYTHEMEERELKSVGKDNFKNFLRTSFVTNNNINVAYKGKYGSIRNSLTYIYNRGQYENNQQQKITYQVVGDINYKNFDFQGGMTFNHRFYPTDYGLGYNAGGYLYNMVIYGGKEYDIRDYKDYWKVKDEEQNWYENQWFANPWLIANEVLHGNKYTKINGFLNMGYKITPWLKASIRSGVDYYSSNFDWKTPKGLPNSVGEAGGKGLFAVQKEHGMSVNADAMLNAHKKFGDFDIDFLAGVSIYYYNDESMKAYTMGGLNLPGWYSLANSVERPDAWWAASQCQTNGVYGKLSLGWKDAVFVDVTGRNDWDSRLPEQERSFFYPSVSSSVIVSEFLPKMNWLDLWKMRGAWTVSKRPWGIYSINQEYYVQAEMWNGMTGASYPATIMRQVPKPQTLSAWEIGTDFHVLKNRLWGSLVYYQNKNYNSAVWAPVSVSSGFADVRINSKTEYFTKGWEVSIGARPIKTKDFEWEILVNWFKQHEYYGDLDPKYTPETPFRKKGQRTDKILIYDWDRDAQGNIIHLNGLPQESKYSSQLGYLDPRWSFGINNVITYKDFELSFTIDGRVGGKMYSFTNQAMWNTGTHPDSDNQWRYDEVVHGKKNFIGAGVKVVSGTVEYDQWGKIISDTRVFAPNDVEVGYEQYTRNYHTFAGNARPQNYFDQTFFKLRNLSLTYRVPREWCQKIGMESASVSLIGQNLLIWTKDFRFSDPDKGYSNNGWGEEFLYSPSCRLYGFNIKVGF